MLLWSNPMVYRMIDPFRRQLKFYEKSYDLLVEAYPRSANTYAAKYLRISQGEGLKVGSHFHIPVVLHYYVRHRRTPVLFILRKPVDAVLSWAIFMQSDVRWELRYYLDYHRTAIALADWMFVTTFENVTQQMPTVVRQVDEVFSLGLRHDYDPAKVHEEVLNQIDQENSLPDGSLNQLKLNRPTAAREPLKAEKLAQWNSPSLAAMRAEAEELYQKIMARSAKRVKAKSEGRRKSINLSYLKQVADQALSQKKIG
jgi:hypothetical protein